MDEPRDARETPPPPKGVRVKSIVLALRARGHGDRGRERLLVVPAPSGRRVRATHGTFGDPAWWRAALVLVVLVVFLALGGMRLAP